MSPHQPLHLDQSQCRHVKEKSDKELLALVLRTQFERVANRKVREIAQASKAELGLTDIVYERLMAGKACGRSEDQLQRTADLHPQSGRVLQVALLATYRRGASGRISYRDARHQAQDD